MWKAMWDALVKKKNTCSIYGMMYNLFTVFTVQNAALKALKSQTPWSEWSRSLKWLHRENSGRDIRAIVVGRCIIMIDKLNDDDWIERKSQR